MFYTIMLLLKVGLFSHSTEIKDNKALIFSVSCLITVFIFTFIYFSRNRRKNGIAFFFYFLMSTVIFADITYYHYFNSLPSITMLKQVGQVEGSIRSIINPINIITIIDLPFIYLRNRIIKRRKRNKVTHYNKEARIGVPLGILATIILVFIMINSWGFIKNIKSQELYTYHFMDIINYLKSK